MEYNHLTKQGLITLKYLAGLLLMSDQIWDFLNNDKKQRILKLLCSEILLDGKNVVISIRKPILALAKIGSCQVWLTKVYDLRKKYEQELAEMYLIVNGMDDDLRQMMTIEKD